MSPEDRAKGVLVALLAVVDPCAVTPEMLAARLPELSPSELEELRREVGAVARRLADRLRA